MDTRKKLLAVVMAAALAVAPAGTALAAPPGAPGGAPGGGSSSSITWSGATTITGAASTAGASYASTEAGQNALLVDTSDAVTLDSPTVTKTGGTSAGDDESFYGTNSAVMCKGGGTTTITGATITTAAAGANGVFSYGGNASTNATSGDGTTVVISDSTITTTGDGSGGIMTTGQGTTKASNLAVSTSGGSSAAIRSDRGGGTVDVDGGAYATSGVGSPAIYATATVTVSDATLTSTASQGVVNEGGNTVVLENCTLNAGNATRNGNDLFNNGVFLYQSMSGDASDGASVFTMTGGALNSTHGHVFHVTNTSAAITLEGVDIANGDPENIFLSVCDDYWSGLSNKATVNATDQVIVGDMLVGSDSTLNLSLSGASTWTGATSGSITSHKTSGAVSTSLGTVNVELGDGAVWALTGDCAVTSLSGTGKINYNGHTLTVGSTAYSSGDIGGVTETADTGSANEGSSASDKSEAGGNGDSTGSNGTAGEGGTTGEAGPGEDSAGSSDTGDADEPTAAAPAKVKGVTVTSKKAGKATVTWSAAGAGEGVDGYQIRYKTAGSAFKTVTVASAGKTSRVLKNLAKGEKVVVQVRAYATDGDTTSYGAWSAKAKAKVKG